MNNPLKYTDPSGHESVVAAGVRAVLNGNCSLDDLSAFLGSGSEVMNQITAGVVQAIFEPVTPVKESKSLGSKIWGGIKNAPKNIAKGVVKGATEVTEVTHRVTEPIVKRIEPVTDVLAVGPEEVLEHTVVPVLNFTGAGIDDIEINPARGYFEVGTTGEGWIDSTLNALPENPEAITLPSPLGSVIVGDQKHIGHEQGHVHQQWMLGPSFIPIYFMGNAIYGYDNNPLEVQADEWSSQ